MLKKAILCVDDEAIILESLKEQLKRGLGSDYRIEVAQSGEEALKILDELTRQEVEVPIIISDHIMPGMNGGELLSQVHARFPETLKIFLTGRADAEAVGNAVNSANLYRYISKPWEAEDLHLTLAEGLRSYSQEMTLKMQHAKLEELYHQAQKEIAERKHAEQRLESQFQFERLVSNLSARFVNISSGQVDHEIKTALQQILEFFQADRCVLRKVLREEAEAPLIHDCYAEGIQEVPATLSYPEECPWLAEKALAGETVSLHVKDFPPEAAIDRQLAEQLGMRSLLVIPLEAGGSVVHVFTISTVRSECTWPEEASARLRLAGEIFVNALERKRAEEELQKSYREIKQLKDRLQLEAAYLQEEIKVSHRYGDIVGQSEAIRRVLNQVEQVAPADSSVLIQGETGAGKELIAQAIHDLSSRQHRVMVKVNCASLPATLVESELFGREKGAYTGASNKQAGRFEVADGSTIFLDEIGELSLEVQAKLLRVLQNGEFERLGSPKTIAVDVRVIAATNRDLAAEVQKRHFREDLYYRLNVFPIQVPPLRERLVDIPALVWAFVEEYGKRMGKKIQKISKHTMQDLQAYPWPGNIRELRNVIERAMIISTDSTLRVEIPQLKEATTGRPLTMAEMEAKHIKEVLEKTNGRIRGANGAAAILGLNPSTLYFRMEKLGIQHKRENIG